jgi:tetratricopeptide (TPR) repeat protein
MSDARKKMSWVVLSGVLIAALYGQFLQNPILFDDLYFFMLGKDGRVAIEQFAMPSLLDLRALPYATLAWTAKIFGYGLIPFRIENLLLHWMVVVALALFVLRLYQQVLPARPNDDRTSMTMAVLIVVSLFAIHSLGVYAAGYLVQRTIVMATLFSLLSLWAYLRGVEGRKAWLWASVALYLLATHSKEHVIMLPAVIVAMTVLVHGDWRNFIRRNWPVFLGYLFVGLLTVAQIRGVIGHAYEINSGEMLEGVLPEHALAYSVLTQSWLYFKYGLLWLLPNSAWHSVDMREPLAQGAFSLYGLAFLAYLLYGFVAFRLLFMRGTRGLIGFALLFPWLLFATEFSTVRIQEIFVLYRSYLWAMGGVIVLPLLLMQLNARLTMLVAVLAGAAMFMMSMERLSTFSHPILLWGDAEKLVADRQSLPGVGRIYYNRGTEWLKIDNLNNARSDLETATRLSPKLSAAFGNLGQVYSRLGQNDRAIQAFSRAIALDQELKAAPDFKLYFSRARAYEALHQFREASIDFQVSCLLAKKGCDKTTLH